jgi:hypothetical protein
MNNNYTEAKQPVRIALTFERYNSVMNTKCQGAVLLSELNLQPKLSSCGKFISMEAMGSEEDAQAIYDWADFCCF